MVENRIDSDGCRESAFMSPRDQKGRIGSLVVVVVFFFSVAYQRSDEMIQPAFASSGGLLVERCLRAARRTQIPYEHIVVDNDLHATTTTTDRPIDDGRTTPDRHAQSRLSSIHLTHLEKVTSFLSSSSPLIILGSSSYGDISHAPCLGYLRNSA